MAHDLNLVHKGNDYITDVKDQEEKRLEVRCNEGWGC